MDLNKIYQYNFPTIIRFGAGSSRELGPYLLKHGLNRPLIVTDPTVSQLDFFKKINMIWHTGILAWKFFMTSIKIR